jgi:hypothetical protein
MPSAKSSQTLVAVFPTDSSTLAVRFSRPITQEQARGVTVRLKSGLRAGKAVLDAKDARRVLVSTGRMKSTPLTVDVATVALKGVSIARARNSVRFAHGVLSPMELKLPNFTPDYPFASTLAGVHVTVECCTGCNGGVHDRNLVVLNSHIGGPWTGVWVQTDKTIEAPYPRWQKVRCAGGVVAERAGSTCVVDQGWMEVVKQFETPHHAPPPLAVDASDLPRGRDTSLLAKSLDGSWLQLSDITVKTAAAVEPPPSKTIRRLVRNEVTVTDKSGADAEVWLYQPTGLRLKAGDRLRFLRGFVHIERPGQWVILSDKEEDLGRA